MKERIHACMWFVHVEGARRFQLENEPEEEELEHMRRQLCLPTDRVIKVQQVVVVVHHIDHYFVVVTDHTENVMYVFGRHVGEDLAGVYIQDEDDWRSWKGDLLWVRLPKLFQWEGCSLAPNLMLSVNWPQVGDQLLALILADEVHGQNGLDCGAEVCSVTKAILTDGVEFDQEGMVMAPTIECSHYGRLRLLNENIQNLQRCHHLYETLGFDTFAVPEESASYAMSVGLEGFIGADTIRKRLATARDRCTVCKRVCQMKVAEQEVEDGTEEQEDEWEQQSDSEDGELECIEGPRNDLGLAVVPTYLTRNKKKKKLMEKARRRVPAKIRAPTTKRGKAIPMKPQRFQMLPRNKRRDFDDYYGGPTLEDMMELQRPGGLEAYPNSWDVAPTIRSPWELFKNYGFTLEPEFALMFNRQEPLMAKEHLLPVGDLNSPTVEEDDDDDWEALGMEEMLAMAPTEGSSDSMNVFVKGVMPDGQTLIKFDPARDAYPLRLDEYLLSLDIDTIIWVTYKLRVLTEISVHVLPYTGGKPPIWKNNHAYAEVLMPQSDRDKDMGGRTEWFSNRKSLSAIPHIHFAKVGQGSGSFNVYVMFPRMMHKNPISGRSATLIPVEIQSLWFTDIVYPAILAGENPSTVSYKDYTLAEWRWKASINERFTGKDKLVVVQGGYLTRMQEVMQDIVDSDPEEYDRYGSFFFVMDCRGIKDSTNIVVGHEGDPYEELCRKFPACDWEYMEKRENGQLLMDLGMGFHPNPDDKMPLVFLWDLVRVNESYDTAGMNAGKVHHAGMMGRYGGRQSEMEQKRQAIVQLCFRSTYSLIYQPFRKSQAGEINMCEDIDAYEVNSTYRSNLESHIMMMRGSLRKSFGAREEMRGSGTSIRQVMQDAATLVSLFKK
jgi:hypothetical protein